MFHLFFDCIIRKVNGLIWFFTSSWNHRQQLEGLSYSQPCWPMWELAIILSLLWSSGIYGLVGIKTVFENQDTNVFSNVGNIKNYVLEISETFKHNQPRVPNNVTLVTEWLPPKTFQIGCELLHHLSHIAERQEGCAEDDEKI